MADIRYTRGMLGGANKLFYTVNSEMILTEIIGVIYSITSRVFRGGVGGALNNMHVIAN